MTMNQGFPTPSLLAQARGLLDAIREFPQAAPALEGLDAFMAPSGPACSIHPWGVAFHGATERDFDQGAAGALGRMLLRDGFKAPRRAPGTPIAPAPDWATDPTPSAPLAIAHAPEPSPDLIQNPAPIPAPIPAPLPATVPPAAIAALPPAAKAPEAPRLEPMKAPASAMAFPVSNSGSNADFFDDQDFGDIPEYIEEDRDQESFPTHFQAPRHAPAPAALAPFAAPAAPPTMAEIRAMMGVASKLQTRRSPLEQALIERKANTLPGAIVHHSPWESWAGAAKKAARSACSQMSLRLESDPPPELCAPSIFALFPIDPGPMPPPGSDEAKASAGLEEAIDHELRQSLRSAIERGARCGGWVAFLSGWGPRAERARSVAETMGFKVDSAP